MEKTFQEQLARVAPSLGFDVKKPNAHSKQSNLRRDLTLTEQSLTLKRDTMTLDLKIGDRVEHRSFGQGIVVRLCPNAQGVIADVKFTHATVYVDSRTLKCSRIEGIRRKIDSEAKRKADAAKQERERKIHEKEERRREERRREEKIELERKKAEELGKTRKQALLTRLQNVFASDFLSADQSYETDPDSTLINEKEYEEAKAAFVRSWAVDTLGVELDMEQAGAVAAVHGDIKVTARAGSGKTRTLVTRAIFLQKHCHIVPQELLLLAFNNTAADEMKQRLGKDIKGPLPHVLTFHKLAHALVHPEEEMIFDDTSSNRLGLSREIQEVIDKHMLSKEHASSIKNLMLSHFRDDWERIVNGGFQLTMDEFLDYRRKLPRESLKGDYVKSFGEKLIANTLYENDIDYRYERNFRWDDFNYRPDFTIPFRPKGGVIIEYFGLQGDADYDDLSEKKRAFWAERPEWTFLEFEPMDIAKNGIENFIKKLLEALKEAGVICKPLPEEEIWERVKKRAIDSFTKAMQNFVSHCRKRNLNTDGLRMKIANHKPCLISEKLFLDVGVSVYKGYMERLTEKQKEDFDGLMWRAVALLRDNQTGFRRDKGRERGDVRNLRFIMIDEFQDFSKMFFELVSAIRLVNPNVQFFCVGDDWQAINAFAGSDIEFFEKFSHYFLNTTQYNIRTNYRSPMDIVKVSNSLMNGLGVTAQSDRKDQGWVRLCDINSFKPTAPEQAKHNGDEITPALLRVVRNLLDRGLNVVMLSRRSGVPWYIDYSDTVIQESDASSRFLEHIRSHLPEEDRGRVTISTTHKYKGLQRDAVIVLDATARSYPLIHPHWFFLRVFDNSIDKIDQEERRLFYVAITRAQNSLTLFTELRSRSPYLNDIQKHMAIEPIIWEDLPPVPSLESPRLEIRVFNAYDVREQLKKLGYNFNGSNKYWYRAVMAEGFSFDSLIEQPWANSGVKIQVYTESLKLLYER